MSFLAGEEPLLVSNNAKVVVSNYRVSLSDRYMGGSFFIAIFLEDISSIETKYKSNVLWLILGCLGVLIGLFNTAQMVHDDTLYYGYLLGALFLFLWWASKRHLIKIGSGGGSALEFEVEQMNKDQIIHFTEVVMEAKFKRVQQLYGLGS